MKYAPAMHMPIGMDADGEFTESLQFFSDRFRKSMWAVAEPFLHGYGLHAHHVPVLIAIGENPGISQKGLRDHVLYDKSRISTIAFELGILKMVEDCSDTKISSLRLTDLGEEVFSGMRDLVSDFCGRLFEGVPDEEIAAFRSCFRKMNDNLSSIAGPVMEQR